MLLKALRPHHSTPRPASVNNNPNKPCLRVSQVLGGSINRRVPLGRWERHVAHVAQRPLTSILAEIESVKASVDALELELAAASRVAEVSAKRGRRLAARSHELQDYALEHVMLGDEPSARSALQQKAAVADALRQATRRAEANSALARKLEELLVLKQGRLLAMLREANKQQQQAAAAAASAAAATAPASQGSSQRGLKRSRSVAWSSSTLHASSDGCMDAAEVAAAAAAAVQSCGQSSVSSAESQSSSDEASASGDTGL